MSFTPYTIQITTDGKCLYSHQFVHFEHNQHLLTGIIAAMKSLYLEVFHEELTELTLQDFHIVVQRIDEMDIYLLYKGDSRDAQVLMTEILDVLCQHDYIKGLQEVVDSSTITESFTGELDELFSSNFQVDFSSALAKI